MNNKITIKATVNDEVVYQQTGLESRLFIGTLTKLPNGPVVVSVTGGGTNVELAVETDIPQLVKLANGLQVRVRKRRKAVSDDRDTALEPITEDNNVV